MLQMVGRNLRLADMIIETAALFAASRVLEEMTSFQNVGFMI
jgi:hypothetical protein